MSIIVRALVIVLLAYLAQRLGIVKTEGGFAVVILIGWLSSYVVDDARSMWRTRRTR